MKKYRLIKKYPGSPTLNTIITIESSQETGYYSENKEFWEEVVEKDYEILTVITNDGKFIEIVYNQSAIIEPFWEIHSVKRLSDGEIFTVGDKIEYIKDNIFSDGCKITHFTIEDNQIYINSHNAVKTNYNRHFSNVKKYKPVLFTTEDGVDIYEGDRYYTVRNRDFSIAYDGNGFKAQGKHFSTQEAAQEYILMNKPCLSINDVNNWYSYLSYESTTYNRLIENLKQLVKSKL